MNISQHTIFPNRCKIGQFKPDGTSYNATNFSRTHFFSLSFPNRHIFLIPSNWVSLFGPLFAYASSVSLVNDLQTPSSSPFTLFDGTNPRLPSNPLSIIIY